MDDTAERRSQFARNRMESERILALLWAGMHKNDEAITASQIAINESRALLKRVSS